MSKKEIMLKLKSKFIDPSLKFAQMQKVKELYRKVNELSIEDSSDVPVEIETEFSSI